MQSDWGGEFRPFTHMFEQLGILHRVICPHTHHQNGMVERKHMQIVETGLTLMAHASLPFKYWDHAFQASVYLINRLPISALQNGIPFIMLYNMSPDYSFLKTFGCSCFPLIRPYNKHKLQLRSQECLFLGYSSNHKGYKCLNPAGRLFISKDVIFNEHHFPYKHLFSTSIKSTNPNTYVLTSIPTITSPTNTPPPGFPPMSHSPIQPPISPVSPASSTNSPSQQNIPSPVTTTPTPDPSHSPEQPTRPHNTHAMQTRAKNGIAYPRIHPTLLLAQNSEASNL